MTYVKDFFFDDEPFLLPYGTKLINNAGNWGLYHNELENWTLVVTRGKKYNKMGWRVRQFNGLMNIKHATNFVETACGGCLGL